MKTTGITFLALFLCILTSQAQLADSCKLRQGMNLGGLADWRTELPFVNLMHNARQWYTRDIDNPNAPWNSELASELTYRADGYPTHVPQTVAGHPYTQQVATIWAITDGWPAGQYTVLWEGTGNFNFWGGHSNLTQTGAHRIVFDFNNPVGNILELVITESDINDPIRNIRVIMPGHEASYETAPFNPVWIEKLQHFPSVRFMDWGQTNNWGQTDTWDDPSLFDWADRAQMDHYTWANEKGIPYEMMVKLMNDYDLDGWVCVPHRASDNYIQNMAEYFRDNLETDRRLSVEYSNEIWNWIFGQTQWLFKYGCEEQGLGWPAGIMPYVQNCLDIWTNTFSGQLGRIRRVVGTQISWQDLSNQMVGALTTGSFDAVSPTFYFGLTEDGDAALDALGAAATVTDVAFHARAGMEEAKIWLTNQKEQLADPLGVELCFYEGGQHLTAHPFGSTPSYGQALIDIQRDTAMYNMYNEWFDFIRTLQTGNEPLELMNFSFVGARSAQYGSWGVLETMTQDTTLIPAPKFSAILANSAPCDETSPPPPPPNNETQNIRQFIFGHSLINHEWNVNPVPGDETSVPHWLGLLTQESGQGYAATGQYGFLPQHANLPPVAQWGFDEVPAVWDSDNESFDAADFNNILLTPANFVQWQAADLPYPNEDGVISPLSATIDIMDWTTMHTAPNMRFYIYENWPDMAPFLGNGTFPPSEAEFASYNTHVQASFHDWWLDYQDEALAARAEIYPRMIPVGPVIAGLLNDTPLSNIPITELYEDDAPHGRPTIYFLSALVTYMAIYGEEPPAAFTVPTIVHSLVADNYSGTVDYIWNYLQNFNDEEGESRVFYPAQILPAELLDFSGKEEEESIQLRWTSKNEENNDYFDIEYSTDNQSFVKIGTIEAQNTPGTHHYSFAHTDYSTSINYYRLRQVDTDGQYQYSPIIKVMVVQSDNQVYLYPNPTSDRRLHVVFLTERNTPANISVLDIAGRQVFQTIQTNTTRQDEYILELKNTKAGMYILRIQQGDWVLTEKIVVQ